MLSCTLLRNAKQNCLKKLYKTVKIILFPLTVRGEGDKNHSTDAPFPFLSHPHSNY